MFESSHPGEHVVSSAPRVTLRNAFAHPFDSAIAAARTCYAPRLITPEEITDKQRLNIGAATFYSGHHTVYQHAHFEFGLENVSRHFVWSFLHAFLRRKEQRNLRRRHRSRLELLSPAFRAAHWRRPQHPQRHLARQRDVPSQASAKNRALRRKARHRNRPLRSAHRRLHHHGAHPLRNRSPPSLAHVLRL